jgi:Fe-S cluster biogenesis protein NfuA
MSWLKGFLRAFQNEPPQVAGDPERIAQVQAVLEELRPAIAADGGVIELASIEGGWVTLRLRGACSHCMVSDATVHGAIEPRLRERHDWVLGVRAE